MSALWLWLVLVGVAAEDRVDPRVLSDDAYRFCHEPGVDAETAREFCDLLEGVPPETCPGLVETCAGAAAPSPLAGCGGGGGGGAPSGVGGEPEAPSDPWEMPSCELPDTPMDSLFGILRWVAAIAVALLVLGVLRLAWRYFGTGSVPEVDDVLLPELAEEADDDGLDEVPNLPSGDLLTAARRALEAGDFGQAVVLARGAALRRLGDLGRLRLHRSRTDREYARALRKDEQVHGPLREVLGAVEVHRWGGDRLDRARSEAAVAAAQRVIEAAGALALLALALAPDLALAQSDRYGPLGDAGLQQVLEHWGHDAGFRLRGLDSLDEGVDVLVLDTTFVVPEEQGWDTLRAWVEGGGVLLVGGACPFEELGERTMLSGPVPVEGTPTLDALGLPVPRYANGPEYAWSGGLGQTWVQVWRPRGPIWRQSMLEREEDPSELVVDFDDQLAVVQAVPVGAGTVLAVADARLLWNGSFVDPRNEQFVGDAVHAGGGVLGWGLDDPARIELATTAAASSPTPSQSMLNADLLPFVIQLLLWWIAVALWRGWPFGSLRDPPEEGRLAFAEHVKALGMRWYRAGSSRWALAQYGGLWMQRLGPKGLRQLARKAGRDEHRAQALVDAITAATEDPTGPDSEHDLEWMEELWTITDNR